MHLMRNPNNLIFRSMLLDHFTEVVSTPSQHAECLQVEGKGKPVLVPGY